MESINFIPANELPEAEGDEVSFLCLEDGELKQKSASGLGSNTDTNYDIVVRIVGSWDAEAEQRSATAEIISGSFDAVVQKLDAGIVPRSLYIETGKTWDGEGIKSVFEDSPSWGNNPDADEGYLYINAYDLGGRLYADGTYELYD